MNNGTDAISYPQRVRDILKDFEIWAHSVEETDKGFVQHNIQIQPQRAIDQITDLITEAQTQELLNTLKFAEGGQVHEDFIISRIKELKPKTGDQ